METVIKKKLYEGMFLVDSAQAGADWEGVIASIRKILERARTEIMSIRKWDERKLAYDIKGKSRGTYILCYFKADGDRIGDIEKAVQLSEHIMRVLILNAEQLKPEDIEKETPAMKMEKERDRRPVSKGSAQSGGTDEADFDKDEEDEEQDKEDEEDIEQDADVMNESEMDSLAGDS